jgi:hypothetical protein
MGEKGRTVDTCYLRTDYLAAMQRTQEDAAAVTAAVLKREPHRLQPKLQIDDVSKLAQIDAVSKLAKIEDVSKLAKQKTTLARLVLARHAPLVGWAHSWLLRL